MYDPASHGEHSPAFASEYVPLLHGCASSAPVVQNEPAGQGAHAAAPPDDE